MGRKQRGSDEPRPFMSDEDHRAELAKAFKLEPGDLEANRAGTLTPRQREKLRTGGVINLVLALAMAVGLIAIVLAVSPRPIKPVQVILVVILDGALVALGSKERRRGRAAAAAGVVECLTGPVRVQLRYRQGWFLGIAGRSFQLPIRGWHVGSGNTCLVYLAPKANRIVAMEPASA